MEQGRKYGGVVPVLFSLAMWGGAAYCLIALSGCSGVGIGGELGIYRIDERRQESRTYNKPSGLRCLFVDCTKEQEEVQGS